MTIISQAIAGHPLWAGKPTPSKPHKPKTPSFPQADASGSNIYLSFYGEDLGSGGNIQRFQAMLGDEPPTITAGYAKWSVVDRPLMRSVTVFTGYEPAQMKVSLRLGQWDPGWDAADTDHQTEKAITALDMMAGSARHYYSSPPQIVYVASWSTQGGFSDVIPPGYQYQPYSGSKLFPWVVNGLEWGTSYRNPNGYRVYQEATVSLLQYMASLGAPPPPNLNTSKAGGWFTAKPGRDTALLIASAPSSLSPNEDHKILANRIVRANGPYSGAKNPKLNLRGINQKIKHNATVWIPSHTEF